MIIFKRKWNQINQRIKINKIMKTISINKENLQWLKELNWKRKKTSKKSKMALKETVNNHKNATLLK